MLKKKTKSAKKILIINKIEDYLLPKLTKLYHQKIKAAENLKIGEGASWSANLRIFMNIQVGCYEKEWDYHSYIRKDS